MFADQIWTSQESTGTKCPEGVYFYIDKYKYKCQEQRFDANGTITLIRPKD